MTAPSLRNDRLLRALRRQPTDRTPIWLMRQAGRYLPEYRAARARAGSFLAMAKTPELACEVALQPLHRFPLDAAILFSDILTVPDAMGLGLSFVQGEGPKFERTVRSADDLAALRTPDMETDLRYVMDAVRLISHELSGTVPLIGFSGSPWTLACYMVEGGSSKDHAKIKAMALDAPDLLHALLSKLTEVVVAYLAAQHAAGAHVLQVFDTWGGVLGPAMYREFSLRYLQRITAKLGQSAGQASAPLILFGKGNAAHLEALAATGADAVGVDWLVDIHEAAQRVGGRVALQGNLDPAVLYGSPAVIQAHACAVLDGYAAGNGGCGDGHVFNLGHGMAPDMDPERVAALVEAVQTHSSR